MRGFGIDATVPLEAASEVAVLTEGLGYSSFWVNGSPPEGALDIVERAAGVTDLDLGVGVFPLTRISAVDLVSQVRQRDLPERRLWMGLGSGRKPGALAEVREAVQTLRSELDTHVVTGAVGPKMTRLAGEIADGVIFTWFPAAEVQRSRVFLQEGADSAGRSLPTVLSFIRCALMPQAAEAVAERAEVYAAIPHYREVFARNQVTAAETVVTGASREEMLAGIEREESVLDLSVIRAIPAANTVEVFTKLLEACAP
jgi:alkanesulfonate monooxygenase SsuD/methylene tetrahydromethanopterin reductase-like flavin-dependent oxidoreductase (luciferase family)